MNETLKDVLDKNPSTAAPAPAVTDDSLINALALHPIREKLYNELHNRPFHLQTSPAQLTHIAIQHDGKLLEQEQQFLAQICNRYQVSSPAHTMPCFYQQFGLFSLRWERHMEYSTYTFIHEAPLTSQPFIKNAIDYVPSDWLSQMPGKVLAALHLVVEPGQNNLERAPTDYFDKIRLVGSAPNNGQARVWTSFKLHADGFGRFLVYDQGLSPAQLGRLTQHLLELETYRLMTTLGLPLAQTINGELTHLELQLKQLTARIAAPEEANSDRELLSQVTSMAARVEEYRAQSNYRFAATSAYYNVLLQRMNDLKEEEIPGQLTLQEFLMRRLTPAVKTCQTVAARLEDISRRITRASDLLRTRVEMVLQEQNQQLLVSMNRRANVQLRLQQTVEGLSVAAISYYSIQLLQILVDSLQSMGLVTNREFTVGLSVPLVIAGVFFTTRYIHRRLLKGVD